jgi:surface antigen
MLRQLLVSIRAAIGRGRRLPAALALTVAITGAGVLAASPAQATTGVNDYPFASSTPDQADGWGFLTRECTSFAAWRIRHDLGISDFTNGWHGGWFGNASNWAANARSLGIPVNGTPTAGSIAQFPPGVDGAGGNGHVAFVLSVGNGTVTVEDYNYADSYDGDTYYNYSQHTVNTSGLNFIHFSGGSGAYITGTVKANPLNVRSGPGTGYSVVGSLAYGARVNISCYNTGTTVTATWPDGSTWTTNVWDGLRNNSTGRFNGTYVSDAWMDTGGDTSKMVPHC